MAGCTLGITGDIINDCDYSPVGGVEQNIVLFNRADISAVTYNGTNKHVVEDIVLKVGKKGYTLTGFKKSNNGGHELVVSENIPDRFKQSLSLVAWGIDSATIKALDNLDDLVAIVEMKNKGIAGDGAYQILGLETGLHKMTDARKYNDNLGTRAIELGTQDGEGATVSYHNFFKTDYATTKALVDSILVQQA